MRQALQQHDCISTTSLSAPRFEKCTNINGTVKTKWACLELCVAKTGHQKVDGEQDGCQRHRLGCQSRLQHDQEGQNPANSGARNADESF